MKADDLRSTLVERLENLAEARAQQRKVDDEVKRLKVEVATLNARFAVTEQRVSANELSHLVSVALDAW